MRSGSALEAKAVPQGGAPSVTGSTSSGSRSRSERCLRSWMPHRRRSQCALLRGWPVLGPLRQSAAAAALNRPPPRRQPILTDALALTYVTWRWRRCEGPSRPPRHPLRTATTASTSSLTVARNLLPASWTLGRYSLRMSAILAFWSSVRFRSWTRAPRTPPGFSAAFSSAIAGRAA